MKFLDLNMTAIIQCQITEFYSGVFSAYEFCLKHFFFKGTKLKICHTI
jgi:hypothetical protein